MALWRNIGGIATIVPGATQYWEYSYGGRDIGLAVAGPNMQYPQINLEMVAVEQGVVQRQGAPAIAYTVRFKNLGPVNMYYNLDIGDWQ
jgi:hypothetical protein